MPRVPLDHSIRDLLDQIVALDCLMIGAEPHLKPLVDIPPMVGIAVHMPHRTPHSGLSG